MAKYFGFEIPHNVTQLSHIPGWTDGRILDILAGHAKGDKTIVEIGSWKGRSACVMAAATDGLVYCVDSWQGGADRDTDEALQDPISVYRQFLAYVAYFGLSDKIIPVCQGSETAHRLFRDRCIDLLFIDGDHRYASVMRDLDNWIQLVRWSGIICGDDYPIPGVNMAVNAFVKLHGFKLELPVDDKMWIMKLQ